MKKTKKLAALFLALMMAFSLMAVTAAAYDMEEHDHECAVCSEDGGIMPIGEMGLCPYCNGAAEYRVDPKSGRTHFTCLGACGKSGYL